MGPLPEDNRVCRLCGIVGKLAEFAANEYCKSGVGHFCVKCDLVVKAGRLEGLKGAALGAYTEQNVEQAEVVTGGTARVLRCSVCKNYKYVAAFCRDAKSVRVAPRPLS